MHKSFEDQNDEVSLRISKMRDFLKINYHLFTDRNIANDLLIQESNFKKISFRVISSYDNCYNET